MFWIVIIALLLVSARMARVYKENIPDTLAVSFAGLLMLMYLLAFFRGLKAIAFVSAIAIVYVLVRMMIDIRRSKSSLAKELSEYGKLLADPGVICTGAVTAFVGFMTRQQVFTWWDDINYWSSDAKQLFFLNGFPGKYGNVSPEFGDYPPIPSLAKWLLLQLGGKEYTESLQFLGYFVLCLIFLLPMLARIQAAVEALNIKKPYKLKS